MSIQYTLITGASAGIGWELALICAQKGENIILVARRRERLEELQNILQNTYSVKVDIFATDIAVEENRTRLFAYTEEKKYIISFLINNAGLGCHGYFVEQERSKERMLVDVNVAALVDLTHLYIQNMKQRGEGRILCISSMAGFQPGPLMASYFASKAFVTRFVEALHYELRLQEINVNVVAFCPGPFESEFGVVSGNGSSNLFQRTSVATAKDMAEQAYHSSIIKKAIYVPGILHQIGVFLSPFVPTWVQLRLVNYLNSSKK